MHYLMAGFLAVVLSTSAFAEGPRYPNYRFHGVPFTGGNSEVWANSDHLGVINVTSFGNGLKSLSLTSDWDPAKIKFRYTCVFKDTAGTFHNSTTSYDGEECPGTPSQFIKGITITLDGTEKDNYFLQVDCRVDYYNNYPPSSYRVGNGQLCGQDPNSGAEAWITELKIEMHRK